MSLFLGNKTRYFSSVAIWIAEHRSEVDSCQFGNRKNTKSVTLWLEYRAMRSWARMPAVRGYQEGMQSWHAPRSPVSDERHTKLHLKIHEFNFPCFSTDILSSCCIILESLKATRRSSLIRWLSNKCKINYIPWRRNLETNKINVT